MHRDLERLVSEMVDNGIHYGDAVREFERRFLDAAPELSGRLLELTRRRALGPSLADCEIIRAQGNKRLGAVAGIIHRLTTGREG